MIKYIIGIDLGHAETTGSYCEITIGPDGEYRYSAPSTVRIRNGNSRDDAKTQSAICKRDATSEWQLASDNAIFRAKDMQSSFKGKIADLGDGKKEYFRVFIKCIYKNILANNTQFIIGEDGQPNFLIYIACPSGWKNKDNIYPITEYGDFVRQTMPVAGVMLESDAAYYKHMGSDEETRILVIDLGSSTIDFTYIDQNPGAIPVPPIGCPVGASDVELDIYNYLKKHSKTFCTSTEEVRKKLINQGDTHIDCENQILYSLRRKTKEPYYCGEHQEMMFENIPVPIIRGGGMSINIGIDELAEAEVHEMLQPYTTKLRAAIENYKTNYLQRHTIDKIVLTGGASRMPFFREMVRSIFNTVPADSVVEDDDASYVVSDGLAKFAATKYAILQNALKAFDRWANSSLEKFLKTTMEDAIHNVQLKLLRGVCDDYIAGKISDRNGVRSYQAMFGAIDHHNETVLTIKAQAISEEINSVIQTHISQTLQNQITAALKKAGWDREVELEVPSLGVDFTGVGIVSNGLDHQAIRDAAEYCHWFTADMECARDRDKRAEFANKFYEEEQKIRVICRDDLSTYASNLKQLVRECMDDGIFNAEPCHMIV